MHIVTVATTAPTGELLHHHTLTTVDIHADNPYQHHAHLIALGDEPYAVIAPRIAPSGRTDLLATLRATTTLTN